jgi:hypothetical protein
VGYARVPTEQRNFTTERSATDGTKIKLPSTGCKYTPTPQHDRPLVRAVRRRVAVDLLARNGTVATCLQRPAHSLVLPY